MRYYARYFKATQLFLNDKIDIISDIPATIPRKELCTRYSNNFLICISKSYCSLVLENVWEAITLLQVELTKHYQDWGKIKFLIFSWELSSFSLRVTSYRFLIRPQEKQCWLYTYGYSKFHSLYKDLATINSFHSEHEECLTWDLL